MTWDKCPPMDQEGATYQEYEYREIDGLATTVGMKTYKYKNGKWVLVR